MHVEVVVLGGRTRVSGGAPDGVERPCRLDELAEATRQLTGSGGGAPVPLDWSDQSRPAGLQGVPGFTRVARFAARRTGTRVR